MTKQKTMFDPGCYQIKVKERLNRQWSDWFDGIIAYEKGVTTIKCEVVDQAALHGLLIRIRDLGLQLISVNRIESDSGKYIHQVGE